MPKYLIVRDFDVGEDRMPWIGRRSRRIIEESFPEVTWLHSHVTVDDGGHVRTYCVYEAPNEGAIRSHSEMLGYHKLDLIMEVAGDVSPEDFPPIEEPA